MSEANESSSRRFDPGDRVVFAEPVNGPPSVGLLIRYESFGGGAVAHVRFHGELLKIDPSQLRPAPLAECAECMADPEPCKACEMRSRHGFEGQCPACANERTRAALAKERS